LRSSRRPAPRGIRVAAGQPRLNRARLHRTLVGLDPADAAAQPGLCYAAGAKVEVGPDDTAWCCELVTERDGRILDATAGRIPTKESAVLIHALEESLGSDVRHWHVGDGSHHLLVARQGPLTARQPGRRPLPSPEQLIGQPWRRALPAGALGEALGALMEQAAGTLEAHPINRVRVDLGENPANAIWLWGVGSGASAREARASRSGLVIANQLLLRGMARTLGLECHEGLASFDERAVERLLRAATDGVARHELVYVHARVDTVDPVERLCAMERLDRLLLKPLTETLPQHGAWRLLTTVDDRRDGSVPFVAIGTGLPRQPIGQLDAPSFAESPLAFTDGAELFSWFTRPHGSPARGAGFTHAT